MSTDLFESDLDLPATDEPSKDVAGLSLEISSEKGLGLELTFGIADKEPADRDFRPWDLHKQHGRKPTQTAGFDEMPLGGADRIAINAAGADLWSPASLDRVIKPDDDRSTGRDEGLYQ